MSDKPTVKYRSMGFPIFEGGSPLIEIDDHPVLGAGTRPVRTSVVQSVTTENGVVVRFETLNTIYELDPFPIDYGH